MYFYALVRLLEHKLTFLFSLLLSIKTACVERHGNCRRLCEKHRKAK